MCISYFIVSFNCVYVILKIIISLSDKHYLDNLPHLLKLSNQALLDSELKKGSCSVSSSLEEINTSPSIERNTSPLFAMDRGIQHSLHHSTRVPSYDSLVGSTFIDSDSSFDSASSDDSMSCDELYSTSASSIEKYGAAATTGKVGSIVIRSRKRRKCSREQRKSLMHHMHIARCKKEKVHAGIYKVLSILYDFSSTEIRTLK